MNKEALFMMYIVTRLDQYKTAHSSIKTVGRLVNMFDILILVYRKANRPPGELISEVLDGQ